MCAYEITISFLAQCHQCVYQRSSIKNKKLPSKNENRDRRAHDLTSAMRLSNQFFLHLHPCMCCKINIKKKYDQQIAWLVLKEKNRNSEEWKVVNIPSRAMGVASGSQKITKSKTSPRSNWRGSIWCHSTDRPVSLFHASRAQQRQAIKARRSNKVNHRGREVGGDGSCFSMVHPGV
jgi:hypothetical protein